jgi:hypothetical protein
MLETLKNRILIAFSYGVYTALIVFFFSSLTFVASTSNSIIIYFTLIAIVSLVELGLLEWVRRRISNNKSNRTLFVLSFHLAGIVSSFIIWVLFHSAQSSLFLFMTTFLVGALLPTMIVILYFIFNVAKSKIGHSPDSVENKNETIKEEMFCLENEAGKLLLKIPVNQLICFEANDNYVIIYYLDKNNSLKKLMERFSLKKMEEILFLENLKFERVHKSFLINPNFLIAISGKAQAYKLELQGLENLIPVSRSYSINLLEQKLIDKN